MSEGALGDTGPLVGDARRIAVLRANALGDFLVTLPALDALRMAYPDAEIVLLGTPMHAELLAGRPAPVDRVEVVPPTLGIRDLPAGAEEDPAARAAFLVRMQQEGFDVAVQLHGGGRWSNPFVRGLGARLTVGLCSPGAEPLDRWVPYTYYQHEVIRFLEAVALIGARPVSLVPRLAVTPKDRDAAKAALDGRNGPVVVVHPGATDGRRRWPAARFAAVADELADRGAHVVITGIAGECDIVTDVANRMRHPPHVLCGALGLSGLVGLLDRSVLVVSNDTGPRHLAEAVGTATVAIYWCGNVINVGPLVRDRHRVHISWRLVCPLCGAPSMTDLYPARTADRGCDHRESWVTDVPLAEVLPDALELYARETAEGRS
jgi:ADP-heptose:LPS heptosyltransferase